MHPALGLLLHEVEVGRSISTSKEHDVGIGMDAPVVTRPTGNDDVATLDGGVFGPVKIDVYHPL